jgi:integrase
MVATARDRRRRNTAAEAMATDTTTTPAQPRRPRHQGIVVRHKRACPARTGGACGCTPTYQAQAYDARTRRPVRKTFRTLAEARAWRADAQVQIRRGTLRAPSQLTLREAAHTWVEGARTGAVRNRSGDPYKPSAVRGYEQSLRLRVLPALGHLRLSQIQRSHIQALADQIAAEGLDASTVRNTLLPLRAIYRRALARDEVAINPTIGLELPAVRGRRDRIATPQEATALLEALPAEDRALWATALYAGLRLGEIRALAWTHIDLTKGTIRIERSWDPEAGYVTPKSRAGTRTVPIPTVLHDHLSEHARITRRTTGLVFGNGKRPLEPATIHKRADRHWRQAGLERLRPHEARHTYASLMIAAGINPKNLSTYMGHASIIITLDRYGHLLPGNETDATAQLDKYLAATR